MNRHLICLDTETTGLDPRRHVPVEIAYWDLTTDERGTFVPPHGLHDLERADPDALEINRYGERLANVRPDWDALLALHALLDGHTLVGSNPAFDAAMLRTPFLHAGLSPEPWHYRLWDLSPYAAGVLGLDELPGLAKVCALLDVPPGDHTAAEDVRAAGECFRELQARRQYRSAREALHTTEVSA